MKRLAAPVFLVLWAITARAQLSSPLNTQVMRRNYEALVNLLERVSDPAKFQDPANAPAIEKALSEIGSFSHPGRARAPVDPALSALASDFKDYVEDTRQVFRAGARGEFVRARVRSMTELCLSCHALTGSDTEFEDLRQRLGKLPLKPVERADFLAATRQFEKALDQYSALIEGYPGNGLSYVDLTEAVRHALNVLVRVKRDPIGTVNFLETLSARKELPPFFRRYVTAWQRQAGQWQREGRSGISSKGLEQLAAATRLAAAAEALQLYPQDPAADILYLRVASLAHEALAQKMAHRPRAEALRLLGVAYDSLHDPLLWALDNHFFETCIRELPHSETARACYQRLAARRAAAFADTDAVTSYLPEDETARLQKLKELAK